MTAGGTEGIDRWQCRGVFIGRIDAWPGRTAGDVPGMARDGILRVVRVVAVSSRSNWPAKKRLRA